LVKSSLQDDRCAAVPRLPAREGVLGCAHSLGYGRALRPALALGSRTPSTSIILQ